MAPSRRQVLAWIMSTMHCTATTATAVLPRARHCSIADGRRHCSALATQRALVQTTTAKLKTSCSCRPGAMATITLHDVPEDVLSRLEQRAQARGRSLNSEVLDCLQRQAAGAADVEDWLRDIAQLRAQVQGGPIPVQDLVAATERESH
ncbi:MAG: Arc family DNA-binding protein [Cyanobacteria bacterium K_DeepCast_35m_m2_023]|nr:Arc family DNA-binding protein [Cyanobacteria bacterium K_DeepCast_35m_m2_023]